MVTDEQLEFMRRQLEAYDALPPDIRRRIAEDDNPIDPLLVLMSLDRRRQVERASAFMREHVAELVRQALAK